MKFVWKGSLCEKTALKVSRAILLVNLSDCHPILPYHTKIIPAIMIIPVIMIIPQIMIIPEVMIIPEIVIIPDGRGRGCLSHNQLRGGTRCEFVQDLLGCGRR